MPVLRPSGSDFTSFVKAAAQYVPAGGGGKPSKSGGVSVAKPGLGAVIRTSQVGALASPTTSAVVINGITPSVSAPPSVPPPSGLTLTQSGTSIVGAWTAYTGALGYTYTLYSNSIYSYVGGILVTTASPTPNTFTYASPVSGTYYYYTLNVTTASGTSTLATSGIGQYIAGVVPTVTATNPSSATITPTIANGYYTYRFTATGSNTFVLTSPSSISAQTLVVGGGGGGGNDQGGGGGAGAALYNSNFAIASGSYSVTVGTGGGFGIPSSNGASSIFSTLTAVGGGGGGSIGSSDGSNGGCGGGAGGYTGGSGGIGSVGGNGGTVFDPGPNSYGIIGGGGGGMGGNGGSASSSGGGQGGTGQTFSLGGNSYLVAGGGGGLGAVQLGSPPVINPGAGGSGIGGTGALTGPGGYVASQPVANTGSGGGGGNTTGREASAGASGTVIIAFISPIVVAPPTSPTIVITTGTATLGWTVASGATAYNWILYRSATSNYNGTSNSSGSTTSNAPTSAPTGLTSGNFWYFTVASSNASGVSTAVVSSIVSY